MQVNLKVSTLIKTERTKRVHRQEGLRLVRNGAHAVERVGASKYDESRSCQAAVQKPSVTRFPLQALVNRSSSAPRCWTGWHGHVTLVSGFGNEG